MSTLTITNETPISEILNYYKTCVRFEQQWYEIKKSDAKLTVRITGTPNDISRASRCLTVRSFLLLVADALTGAMLYEKALKVIEHIGVLETDGLKERFTHAITVALTAQSKMEDFSVFQFLQEMDIDCPFSFDAYKLIRNNEQISTDFLLGRLEASYVINAFVPNVDKIVKIIAAEDKSSEVKKATSNSLSEQTESMTKYLDMHADFEYGLFDHMLLKLKGYLETAGVVVDKISSSLIPIKNLDAVTDDYAGYIMSYSDESILLNAISQISVEVNGNVIDICMSDLLTAVCTKSNKVYKFASVKRSDVLKEYAELLRDTQRTIKSSDLKECALRTNAINKAIAYIEEEVK